MGVSGRHYQVGGKCLCGGKERRLEGVYGQGDDLVNREKRETSGVKSAD